MVLVEIKTPDEKIEELHKCITEGNKVVVNNILKIPLDGEDKGSLTKYGIVGQVKELFKKWRKK
jgi:hypothetical protein